MLDLSPILEAARRAAVLCREVQKYHIMEQEKPGHEPVTIADYGSQAIINAAIAQHFPADSIMAEESSAQFRELVTPEQRAHIAQLVSGVLGRHVSEDDLLRWLDAGRDAVNPARTWVIDPIDGTKGFLALRHYVVAVGVLENDQPTAAVMAAPAYPGYERGALFHAQDGAAYVQPLTDSDAQPTPIRASTHTDPTQVRVLESVEKSHASHDRMARVRTYAGLLEAPLERVDSQEKYARIAAGHGELYLRLPRLSSTRGHSTWDHAAGAALVFAAGATVTDVDGSPLDFSTGRTLSNNQGMIVSNGAIHAQVLAAVKRLLAEEEEAAES